MEPTPAELRAWLASSPPELAWLDRPTRHHFRWRDAFGRWHEARRRVPDALALARACGAAPPRDLFVGTSSWLDPVGLPSLHDRERPAPVLLDHLVVFDVDRAPFSLLALERARRDTVALVDWLARDTDLVVVHVLFTGGKGFHVVARDPDRTPFAVADPREREQAVRAARGRLLRRVLDAGHVVDPAVTADTRRVVRVPGSLHGTTGWRATIVPAERLRAPIRTWLRDVARRPDARVPPRFALPPLPRLWRRRGSPPREEQRLEVQASTHVTGTRDRQAVLLWLPRGWDLARAARLCAEEGLGPVLLWRQDDRLLLLVPRALPRDAFAASLHRAGLRLPQLSALGHAWVRIAPRAARDGPSDGEIEPLGAWPGAACQYPWSRPHLALARRLGQPIVSDGEIAGTEEPSLRLVGIA